MTPASELTYHFPKSGRLASLLLHDWYAGIATTEQAPLPPCSSLRGLRRTANMPEDHDFIRLPSQSSQEWDSNQVISCICKYCRYHFVFTVDTTPDQRQKQKQSGHLEHHFVVTDLHSVTEEDHTADQNKYKPLTRQTAYECSLCGTVAQVSMLRPRLQNKWIELITDQDRIHRSFRLAQKNDPERYADATPEKEAQWASTALTTLSAYLKNILNDDGTSQRKRISARNKTFTVQFGEDCEPIFEYLGFEKKEEDGELYWLQPRLPPRGNRTLLWSERAFFEDVRSEVQSILENSKSSANQPMVRAISSGRESLTKALGCEFPKGKTRLNPQYVHVRLLGVPDAADDEILQYAYSRQVAVDGEHRRQYIDALGNICQASNRSGELQVYVTTERDLDERMRREQQSTPDPLLASYARLNIEEINFKEPQMIIAQFRSLVHLNQSLTWEHSPRSDLLEIAKFLNNEQLRCEAFDYEMRHEEACLFFRLQTTTDLRSIYNVVNSLVSRSSSEEIDHLHLAAKALNPILENRERCEGGSEYLRLLVDIQENLWNGLNGSSLSPLYLTEQDVEMVGGAAPDSTSPTPALPPGLTNIGNTCYLNSILQYCYSLAEIRNYAQSCSQSSDEEISSWLRQGGLLSLGREAERNRAYLGFQCARELGLLFQQMESTRAKFIRPRQELANVVLISPHAKPSQRPPLPPRNTVSNSANATDAADISLPSDIIENLETASNASSETLVGLADADDEASTIKIRDGKSEDAVENSTQPAAPVAPTAGVSTEFTLEELDTQIKKQATGTGQMDVDEILSRILDHLQATMQLTPVTKGEDLVEKAFYSKDAHWQKVGDLDWVRTTPTIRFHNAIPAESGSRSLEDALAADLGLSGNEHFVAISTIDVPSPILPILISRSQHQGGESMKNSQPIRIPHELVLDRFIG
ncbi:hypothetical protein QBC35DRAFT_245869 [Podospora australis]|uniref:ubiquitinyl hydrolase 1 n=1 Tax=Podospora australis TaxID=1536484 RepID=A0AAN7AM78_9PEZI|nr:hypothetical protein QBC35DRAFT_245869 [Podospora australis]